MQTCKRCKTCLHVISKEQRCYNQYEHLYKFTLILTNHKNDIFLQREKEAKDLQNQKILHEEALLAKKERDEERRILEAQQRKAVGIAIFLLPSLFFSNNSHMFTKSPHPPMVSSWTLEWDRGFGFSSA